MIMKRALLKQMRHEWRDNIWLVLGLALVCTSVWFMTLKLTIMTKGLFEPLGADPDDVYVLSIASIPPSSPEYVDAGDDAAEANSDALRALIANIRRSPYVEAAAYGANALPYSMSYYGNAITLDNEEGSEMSTEASEQKYYSGNIRRMSPDMVRVLRLESLTGKSQDDLERLLRDGNIFVTNIIGMYNAALFPEDVNGKTVNCGGYKYRVGDIIRNIRRSDYEMTNGGMIIMPIDESGLLNAHNIAVRLKPGTADKFREEFQSTPAMQKQGNKILHELTSLRDRANGMQRSKDTHLRLSIGLSLLLVVIVALGVMGVFWFRIQQRVSETAIRKVCGAKNSDIFRRIISEGLILLTFSALIMAAAGWPLLKATLLSDVNSTGADAVISRTLTVALMAVAIVICIWLPARKAIKIEPAIAIKDE